MKTLPLYFLFQNVDLGRFAVYKFSTFVFSRLQQGRQCCLDSAENNLLNDVRLERAIEIPGTGSPQKGLVHCV